MKMSDAEKFFALLEKRPGLRKKVRDAEQEALDEILALAKAEDLDVTEEELREELSKRWVNTIMSMTSGDSPDDPSICIILSERPGF